MRQGRRWWVAGLVAVLAFAAVWILVGAVGPLRGVRDAGARLTLGAAAGAVAGGLAALRGRSPAGDEGRREVSRQAVVGSSVGGDVVQITGARGNVRMTVRNGPAAPPPPLPPSPPPGAAPVATPAAAGGQFVERSAVGGSVVQIDGVTGDVEVEA
ncbi:hypothetical protein ACFVVL_00665 [Kitasatospora sp. NPDC058115]|uniref:hypothetical protein n=1 Tax=Kitasatospora sp. NPDC058115 TaxID=3346347 RepID=UPI0036DBE930